MTDYADIEYDKAVHEYKEAKVDKFLNKDVIDFCDFLDMVTPLEAVVNGVHIYEMTSYDEVSDLLRSFCKSNNYSYYMFESGTPNPLHKALVLSEEENTVGIIMENIS